MKFGVADVTIVLTADWGPYANGADARGNLCRFVDKLYSPDVGIAWAAQGNVFPLRAPRRDAGGFGDVAVFDWRPDAISAGPKRPATFWEETKAVALRALDQLKQEELLRANTETELGNALVKPLSRIFTKHQDDAAGVALDFLCVAFSVGLVVSGIGAVGLIAFFGSAVLLGADGYAYGLEMADADEQAKQVKEKTEILRLIATLLTLPDLGWGGLKAVREYNEVRDLAQLSKKTALVADALAARSTSAARVSRYEEIAEKARLRSQIRAEQLRGLWLHEMIPRGSGAGSVFFLLKEEFSSDQSVLMRFLQGLKIHSIAVHS